MSGTLAEFVDRGLPARVAVLESREEPDDEDDDEEEEEDDEEADGNSEGYSE
jgi:hypothetical protein